MEIKTTNALKTKTLIFLHIPKCAGSTLSQIIESKFAPEEIFRIRAPYLDSLNEFRQMPEEERKKIMLLDGHFSYGVHELIPSSPTYITMLRDPVDRIISLYYFVLADIRHPMHHIVKSRNMDIADFASYKNRPELDNGQTRQLSGRQETDFLVGTKPCSLEDLERAKRHLRERFTFVGLTERFDESLVAMSILFGWDITLYNKTNITKRRLLKKQIPNNVLRIIKENNLYDMELYEYGRKLFKKSIADIRGEFVKKCLFFKLKKHIFIYLAPNKLKRFIIRYIV